MDVSGIRPCVLICMGVSGAGKSTVAKLIDTYLGWPFQEGDDLHPERNVEKMRNAIPLDDEDRWPWLDRCREWIDERVASGDGGLITCSALKRAYRDRLIGGRSREVRILYLKASRETLITRLTWRKHEYMPMALLDSQLTTLEEPAPDEDPIVVSVEQTAEQMTQEIITKLREATG